MAKLTSGGSMDVQKVQTTPEKETEIFSKPQVKNKVYENAIRTVMDLIDESESPFQEMGDNDMKPMKRINWDARNEHRKVFRLKQYNIDVQDVLASGLHATPQQPYRALGEIHDYKFLTVSPMTRMNTASFRGDAAKKIGSPVLGARIQFQVDVEDERNDSFKREQNVVSIFRTFTARISKPQGAVTFPIAEEWNVDQEIQSQEWSEESSNLSFPISPLKLNHQKEKTPRVERYDEVFNVETITRVVAENRARNPVKQRDYSIKRRVSVDPPEVAIWRDKLKSSIENYDGTRKSLIRRVERDLISKEQQIST